MSLVKLLYNQFIPSLIYCQEYNAAQREVVRHWKRQPKFAYAFSRLSVAKEYRLDIKKLDEEMDYTPPKTRVRTWEDLSQKEKTRIEQLRQMMTRKYVPIRLKEANKLKLGVKTLDLLVGYNKSADPGKDPFDIIKEDMHTIEELAKLSDQDYKKIRLKKAKELDTKPKILDLFVNSLKPQPIRYVIDKYF